VVPTSTPQVTNPQDRSAANPVRQASFAELISLPIQRKSENEAAGWMAN
jgi:hypothetical protein